MFTALTADWAIKGALAVCSQLKPSLGASLLAKWDVAAWITLIPNVDMQEDGCMLS